GADGDHSKFAHSVQLQRLGSDALSKLAAVSSSLRLYKELKDCLTRRYRTAYFMFEWPKSLKGICYVCF
ncbi:MAG: hypothetical protein MKZ95_15275, partial [Pirellulales bacterium]|nr:hypothetical protein [Pirellulales bacterium]